MELGNLDRDLEVWVPFGDDGEVLIKYVPKDELLSISEKATKRKWNNHRMTEEVDPTLANRILGRAAVRDWKNLTVGGEPLPFSCDNLDMLMGKSYVFSNFINQVATDIQAFIEQRKEDEGKNS